MDRRKFIKMTAATVAASLPSAAKAEPAESNYERQRRRLMAKIKRMVPAGFVDTQRQFTQFCAMAAEDRIFYALTGSKITPEKSDPHSWHPTGWGHPPKLPIPGGSWDGVPMVSPIPHLHGKGPFDPTWDSLSNYECPEWYRDAKFGIWNHWSPQCVPEDGDWYARNMYMEGSGQYEFELKHYGPQCRFGYKDLCAQWTLLNWQPDILMDLYVKAGAKFFMALANHHDGFDTWNSVHHQWNAQNIGPHRDVIGGWAKAARDKGLPFGVSVHAGRNWWWFQTAHGADNKGPHAQQPYDGHMTQADGAHAWWEGYDPQQLYNVKHPPYALPDISWVKNYYDRTRDLVDQHNPDVLYFDNALLPLGWAGMNLGAYFYNRSLKLHGGQMRGVINVGNVPPHLAKAITWNLESGVVDGIQPYPWQTGTCIGGWHYQRALFNRPGKYGGYKHPALIIHWLIDVVSKNGTFILDIPGKPDGTIDRKEAAILEELAAWFAINGEAIYGTRPWVTFGEGERFSNQGAFIGEKVAARLTSGAIRFTRNKANNVIYAMVLGIPNRPFMVTSLARASGIRATKHALKVTNVRLLGHAGPINWRQSAAGLGITPPKDMAKHRFAVAFAISVV